MFGLFSAPYINIRKRVPQHALTACLAIESYAEVQLEDASPAQPNHALASILSVWACNTAVAGGFQLSQSSYRWIPPETHELTIGTVRDLKEKGLIPNE